MSKMKTILSREEVCKKYGAEYVPIQGSSRLGVSRAIRSEGRPINGLRHSPHGNMSGWYIYGGISPMSTEVDYFDAYHVDHLPELLSPILNLLGLPPGWRFLWAEGYLDVWYDPQLVD